jgi:hypothetical protein
LQRRERVADLYLKGWTQVAIARECGISQPTICDDLAKIRELWRKSSIRDFDGAREIELQKIDRIEREAWAAWERSQQPTQSAVVTGEDMSKRTRKSVQQKYGDPRFLDIVHKCIAQRRAMLGLDTIIVESSKSYAFDVQAAAVEQQEQLRALAAELKSRVVNSSEASLCLESWATHAENGAADEHAQSDEPGEPSN